MMHSVRFTCVLDTNVLFPLQVRDLLFWFAHYELYTPKWSSHIFDEWIAVMARKGVPEEEIARRVGKAQSAFPDALVHDYESLIDALKLPDPRDRHVVAVAIRCNAQVIVTNNLRDFPADTLHLHGITVKQPDDFLTDIIDLNHEMAITAFRRMVMNRKNPVQDEIQVLDALHRNGLPETANYLRALL